MKAMTMKTIYTNVRTTLACAALLASVALAGCATGPAPHPTPAQIVAQVCPAAQLTMASLTALEDLPAAARADLAKAAPVVGAVCARGTAVDLSSLQSLASTVTPALLRVADAAGLSPIDHKHIADDLAAVQLVLNLALISAGKAPVLLSPSAPAPLVPPQPSDASVLQ